MNKFHHLGLRITTDDKKMLRQLCDQENRTASNMVRHLIRTAYEVQSKQNERESIASPIIAEN